MGKRFFYDYYWEFYIHLFLPCRKKRTYSVERIEKRRVCIKSSSLSK